MIECDEQTIEQYVLRDGSTEFHLAQKLRDGALKSTVITGLSIPVAAVFDDAANLRAIQSILSDHQIERRNL